MKKSLPLILFFLLAACGSKGTKPDLNQAINVARILSQVNDAIEVSIDPNDKEFPPISSVQLDLEVAVTTSFDGSLPIAVLTPGVSNSKEQLHHISLVFVPKPNPTPAAKADKNKANKLAIAIRAVYQSVAHASNSYKFQNGSITLQCTLKAEVDAGITGIGLVPIQVDASDASQTVQSITLNFGGGTVQPIQSPTSVSQPKS